jgi:hypothetical protein
MYQTCCRAIGYVEYAPLIRVSISGKSHQFQLNGLYSQKLAGSSLTETTSFSGEIPPEETFMAQSLCQGVRPGSLVVR